MSDGFWRKLGVKSARASGLCHAILHESARICDDRMIFHWYTPAQPLLKGTRRAALLDAGILTEQDIPALKIREYQKIRLFNAMLPFGKIELPCTHIE